MDIKQESDVTFIDLGDSIKVSFIDKQKEIYLTALQIGKAIKLHGGNISALDTPSLQLLLSFFLTAQQQEITVQWQTISPQLEQFCKQLGMAPYCDLPH